jgi:hypothetical protein
MFKWKGCLFKWGGNILWMERLALLL